MRDGSLNEYKRLYESMEILASWVGRVRLAADKVLSGKLRYMAVGKGLDAPWYLVGIVHLMESNCDWEKGLHSGESWRRVTKLEEKGRGPFATWEASALDALRAVKTARPDMWDGAAGWSIAEALRYLERYNGGGYLKRGVHSPYLWSGSNHGVGVGKYVADGKYDPDAVSGQVGAACVLRELLDKSGVVAAHPDLRAQVASVAARLDELVTRQTIDLEALKAEVRALKQMAGAA